LRKVPVPVEELLTSQDGHRITFTDYVPTAECARIVSIRETNSLILYSSVLSFVTMEAGDNCRAQTEQRNSGPNIKEQIPARRIESANRHIAGTYLTYLTYAPPFHQN